MNLTKLVTDPRVDALYCTLASFCPVDLSLHPHNLSNRPEWRLFLDALTDLFNTMHVASVVHARLEATAPWGLIREAEDAKEAMPHSSGFKNPPSQLAHFGMVARGNCWLSVKGIPESTSSHRRRLLPVSAGEHLRVAGQPTYTCAQFL